MNPFHRSISSLALAGILAPGTPTAVFAQDTAQPPAVQGPSQGRAPSQAMLTPEERAQFREKMRAAKSREERFEIQKQMRGTMEQRAKEKGIELPRDRRDGQAGPRGPQGRPGFDGHSPQGDQRPVPRTPLFTQEERSQYRDKLRAAKTPEEHQSIRNEMRTETEKRAKEKGITLPQRPRREGPAKPQPPAQQS
jgi:hypothetical protein